MAKYKIIPSSRTIVQSPISIGHKAEKGVEAIEFDLTAWVETYGSGTLTVIMRRWGDAIPYPIALEIDENNKATWTLSDTDTAKAGMAYAQLSYIVGETVVKKSDIYTFRVMDSLTGEGEPPEAYESWLETLTHLAAEAMAEVLDIKGAVTDKTLTIDGGIADAKATGDALSALEDQFSEETDKLKADLDSLESGLSDTAKAALLTCFEHVAWIDEHGQTYYNALEDALYPNRYWDYEWDATSGVAPSKYFDSYEHDFVKYPDAMYADNFYFDFNHVGDTDVLFVAKMATEAISTHDLTPQISVRSAQGSNGYNGFKVFFNTTSGKVESNLSGNRVSTDIDYTNYHEYRVKYENGVGYLYVDGTLVAQGTGVTNNQYIYMTGIFASGMGENGHPNISVSIPYSRMAIKSVKYKGLS